MFNKENETILGQQRVYSHEKGTFFSKVMFFFALAMLISLGGTFLGFVYVLPLIVATPALMWVLFAAELGLVFTSRWWSTKRPMNYVLFSTFALLSGITIAPLIAITVVQVGVGLILKALAITALMFTGTAIYGFTTHRDLSGMGGFLMIALIGMIITGVFQIFFPWGSTFELFFAGGGVIIFSAFTMYDIQMIKRYPEDRYIDAALNLYLDIFNLFIYVLRFLLAMSRD